MPIYIERVEVMRVGDHGANNAVWNMRDAGIWWIVDEGLLTDGGACRLWCDVRNSVLVQAFRSS